MPDATIADAPSLSSMNLDFETVGDLRFLIEDALAARGCPVLTGDEGIEEHYLCLSQAACLSAEDEPTP